MKNSFGTIVGFLFGMIGFLGLFKMLALDRIPPSDELAPGIVVFASILTGALCAFAGRSIQRHFRNSSSFVEPK